MIVSVTLEHGAVLPEIPVIVPPEHEKSLAATAAEVPASPIHQL